MTTQNGTKTAADLDLSHIPGIESLGLNLGGSSSASPSGDSDGATGSAAPSEPVAPVDYSEYTEQSGATAGASAEVAQGPSGAGDPDPQPQPDLWAPLLEQVPEPLHEVLQPTLDEYRRQLTRRDEQLEPFQEWIQRGLQPEDILMALQTQQQLLSNPQGFWQDLGQRYGWAQQPQFQYQPPQPQQQQPAAGQFDDIFGDQGGEGDVPPAMQQALAQLAQQQAQIQAQMQAQQEQQQAFAAQQQNRARVDQEFAQLETKYGQLDQDTKDEIARRAIANYHAGVDPSVTRAFHELRDFENKIAQRYARQRPQAPVVVGGGSGQTPPPAMDLSTPEKRNAAAYALAIQMGAEGQANGYRA